MDHDETDVRELYLAANVHEFVRGNTEKHKNKAYFQRIRAALGEYVKGETINDDDETLKSLKHLYGDRTLAYEWEFKITFHPAARIFGFFAKRNCLVLFVPELRSNLQTEDFRRSMEKNRDRWVAMFGNIAPIKSGVLADCMDNFKCQ
jgi:hypothetical protein